MDKARICASIINSDIRAVREVEPLVDLYEVRIDLIGGDWEKLAGELRKPWIACNRIEKEGGQWKGNEARRIEKLLQAVELGADMIDIELQTTNLDKVIKAIKKRTRCLVSLHDPEKTPSLEEMKKTIEKQLKAGADICKLVTTAKEYGDNLKVLKLMREFPGIKIVSFAMGPLGGISRVLCPLAGGDFTYASIGKGKESAPGQLTVQGLVEMYRTIAARD
jgi:3-dehydroquinate dehydratase-1